MPPLHRDTIAKRCAEASGLSPEKCDEVFWLMVETIGHTLRAKQRVMIENFGTFATPMYFRPAATLVERLADAPVPPPTPSPSVRRARAEAAAEAELEAELLADAADRAAAPPPPPAPPKAPLRPEDRAIIERWIAARQGRLPMAVAALYPTQGKRNPITLGAPSSVHTARSALRKFARRCDVPLVWVGMADRPTEGLYPDEVLRREIFAYWEYYEAAAQPRLEKFRAMRTRVGGAVIPLAMRTAGWTHFVRHATDFYEWLIDEGLRPAASNPFRGIARASPIDFSKGKVMVVRAWYRAVMSHSTLSARERAMIFLLSSGLRADEVVRVRLDQLSLSEGRLTVIGKASKRRDVILLPWVIAAIDAYLRSRRHSTSPWLFMSEKRLDQPLTYHGLLQLVHHVAARVFPTPQEDHIRRHIHPHGFRHFYITNGIAVGMNPKALINQSGHANIATLNRYVTPDVDVVERETKKLLKKREWFS